MLHQYDVTSSYNQTNIDQVGNRLAGKLHFDRRAGTIAYRQGGGLSYRVVYCVACGKATS